MYVCAYVKVARTITPDRPLLCERGSTSLVIYSLGVDVKFINLDTEITALEQQLSFFNLFTITSFIVLQ